MGKAEIACYEQFLLFVQCFQKICTADTYNPGFVWERVKPLSDDKILGRSILKHSADDTFKFDEKSRKFSKQVENTVGKGEIARYK